jgi:UDP-N-acetylglucosamine--N-acetylmuramyl-(pentapeptide) pyrophosphoryl-undecaprenol N-acetylglucosamine transferase
VKQGAAVLLADADAVGKFKEYIDDLLQHEDKAQSLATAIKKLAMPDAANALVQELELLLK